MRVRHLGVEYDLMQKVAFSDIALETQIRRGLGDTKIEPFKHCSIYLTAQFGPRG